jgi:hypothetical protein
MMVSINQTITISSDTVEDTVEVLKKNNISVEKSLIPTRMHNMPILQMQNTQQDADAFAERILGEGYTEEKDGDVSKYTLGSSILTVEGCAFSYIKASPSTAITDLNETTVQEHAKKVLERFHLNTKYAVVQAVKKQKDGGYTVAFSQRYAKKDIFNVYITMTFTPQGLKFMKGYWLTPKKFTSEKYPIRHVTSILINFIRNEDRPKDKKVTITDISLGYRADTNDDVVNIKTAPAIPVWRITTDDGKVYYYEAMTGDYIIH